MRCGHCGTEINAGYTTCPACGAVYRQRSGFRAEFPAYLGFSLIAAGALFALTQTHTRTAPVILALAGIGLVALGRAIKRAAPYRWYRR